MAEHNTPTAAEVEEYLKGIHYPAKTEDLRQRAEENGAADDPRVMRFFEKMPDDTEFESVTAVSKALHTYKEEQDESMDEAA